MVAFPIISMRFVIHTLQKYRWLSVLFIYLFGSLEIVWGTGKLNVGSAIADGCSMDMKILHRSEGTEGYDLKDSLYGLGPSCPYGNEAKIISRVGEYELDGDSRPEDSLTSVYLELSLKVPGGGLIHKESINYIWLEMPIAGPPYVYDFGYKPLTLWKRSIIDPNENPNDPNNYTISFMADIREVIDKNRGVVPLAPLNGTYASEVPYLYAQVRFNTFPGDLNLRRRADMQDFAYLAQDWGKTDVNSIADISGPSGVPDKNLNIYDLALFSRDWLKDCNDPNTWRPFVRGQARNQSPPNGGMGVGLHADLSWTAGSDAISYNVYFGTDQRYLSCVSENQPATTFDPGPLNFSTRYYWRIDVINSSGKITGTVWTFTTIIE